MTRLLPACFVANSLNIDVSCSSTKRSVQRNVKFGRSKAKAKLLSRLSHKVCRCLSSPVLLRKFTISGGGGGGGGVGGGGGGGGEDSRSGTEKRCSHNLQGGHPAWWSADNYSISTIK